jgi:uncharacterized protein YjbI with pentapeptide repeats
MVDKVARARVGSSRQARAGIVVVLALMGAVALTGCLTTPGDLEGTARDAHGAPLEGIVVTLFDGADEIVGTTVTGVEGAYGFADVAAGYEYAIGFHDPTGAYADWWFDGAWSLLGATPVAIGNGATTVADATMIDSTTAASITGTVTSAETATPLHGVAVALLDASTGHVLSADDVATDLDGSYSIPDVSPGDYVIRFGPTSAVASHGHTYNGGARSFGTATPIAVGAGATIDVDATLAVAGSITGEVLTTVPAEAGNSAVAGVHVLAAVRDDLAHPVARTTTDADGSFTLAPLPPGELIVAFVDVEGAAGVRGFAPATFGTRGRVDPVGATAVHVLPGQAAAVSAPQLAGADCTEDLFPGLLVGANVAGLDLSGHRLAGCSFGTYSSAFRADLSGADLLRTMAPIGSFIEADLSGARLDHSLFGMTGFSRANFTGASVRFVTFAAGTFTSALDGADFTRADLTGSTFGEVSNLATAVWSDTTCPDGTNSDAGGGTCVGHLIG